MLTNVGLEHTRWLGPTVADIAEEKLAVARAETPCWCSATGSAAPALAVAERVARERGARIVRPGPLRASTELLARGAFQRRNFALARAAAEAYLRRSASPLDEEAVTQAGASTAIPGTPASRGRGPADGVRRRAQPRRGRGAGRVAPRALGAAPIALVMGVLEDKDAATMLATLMPFVERAWFTAPPSGRALSPAALQSLARQLGFEQTVCEPRSARALEQAQRWAREHGGAVLVTGSVYLVGELLGQLDRSESQPAADAGRGSSAR